MTDQSHSADEAQCGSVHSASELRNVPRAHLATGEAQAMPIFQSGRPFVITYLFILLLITDLVITGRNDVIIGNNNVITT